MAASSIFVTARASGRPTSTPRSAPPDVPRGDGAVVLEPRPLVIGRLLRPEPKPTTAPTLDAQLVAILDAPLDPGETAMAGFARKERELFALLGALDAIACRTLQARLTRATDPLAQHFARLTAERRGRLLAFLADARRREAIAAARR